MLLGIGHDGSPRCRYPRPTLDWSHAVVLLLRGARSATSHGLTPMPSWPATRSRRSIAASLRVLVDGVVCRLRQPANVVVAAAGPRPPGAAGVGHRGPPGSLTTAAAHQSGRSLGTPVRRSVPRAGRAARSITKPAVAAQLRGQQPAQRAEERAVDPRQARGADGVVEVRRPRDEVPGARRPWLRRTGRASASSSAHGRASGT